ncbi:MAG: type II toxin-antitoxin system Phd/YefM family antitoxin [Dehalococcoidia bacterium]
MSKQVELSELQQRGEAILDDLRQEQEPYIVARDGEPGAVLVPYFEFLRWRRAAGESADEHFDRVVERLAKLNAHWSDEQIARDAAEAIAEVRRGDP